jgi:guanosine-3',5'-bis(diphosphate) 3'-pyrophosphohydrolase
MATIERAISIAAEAHAGQFDKANQPYILHPLRVMLRLSTDQQRIAAALHDVVEDTPVTLDRLRSEGFTPEIVAAVEALTKRPGETRMQAAARAAANPIARLVKLADNAENMDLSRIKNPTPKDFARLEEYKQVRQLLIGAEGNEGTVQHDFDELLAYLERVPAISGPVSTGEFEDRNWWVKFSLNLRHPLAWNVVQEFGCVLNYLSIIERLPTVFRPVSPPPYLNGGPGEFLAWVIESKDPTFKPDAVAECLEGRLPRPVDDLEQWKVDNDR